MSELALFTAYTLISSTYIPVLFDRGKFSICDTDCMEEHDLIHIHIERSKSLREIT